MSEQDDDINHEAIHLVKQIEVISDEKDKLEDTLIKANKTITNLFRKEPMLYPDIAELAIVRTLTFEKINAEMRAEELRSAGAELLESTVAFKEMLLMIHQELVNVEKVDQNNPLAQKIRRILGNPEDYEENKG